MPAINTYEVTQVRKVQVSAISIEAAVELAGQVFDEKAVTSSPTRGVYRRWIAELSAKEL